MLKMSRKLKITQGMPIRPLAGQNETRKTYPHKLIHVTGSSQALPSSCTAGKLSYQGRKLQCRFLPERGAWTRLWSDPCARLVFLQPTNKPTVRFILHSGCFKLANVCLHLTLNVLYVTPGVLYFNIISTHRMIIYLSSAISPPITFSKFVLQTCATHKRQGYLYIDTASL